MFNSFSEIRISREPVFIKCLLDAFVQEMFSLSINLMLALFLVLPRRLFGMLRAFMFSRHIEILRIDGYLDLILLTLGNLTVFCLLLKYVYPLSMGRSHPSMEKANEGKSLFTDLCLCLVMISDPLGLIRQ